MAATKTQKLSTGNKAPKKESLPSDYDIVNNIDSLIMEWCAIPGNSYKKNAVVGNSYLAARKMASACRWQMLDLEYSDPAKFAEYMSDKYDSLPLRTTIPSIVYRMFPILKGKPVEDKAVQGKCKSFYTRKNAVYHGYLNRLIDAKVILKRGRFGANGAPFEDGRGGVILWISKDVMLGERFVFKGFKNSDNNENASTLPQESPQNGGSFFTPKVGESEQMNIKEIISNEIIKNKDTKQCGVLKTSSCENVENGDDVFKTKKDAITSQKKEGKDTDYRQVSFSSGVRPNQAVPRGEKIEKIEDGQALLDIKEAQILKERATELADIITEMYKKALTGGQVQGSAKKVFTESDFPQWEWKRIHTNTGDVLRALHKESETWFETAERIKKTLEIEQKRLKNTDKFLLLPCNYLNTEKNAFGDWKMFKGSLVAFHDFLQEDKQLEVDVFPNNFSNDVDYNIHYQKALGAKCKILRELGIRPELIERFEAIKGAKNVIKTIESCLRTYEKGKIKASLKAYILRSLHNCGWTVNRVLNAINFLKDKEKFADYKKYINQFYAKSDDERKEILYATAEMCSKKNFSTPAEVFLQLCEYFKK